MVVVNAAKVVLTDDKAADKFAYRHSGYPGGLKPRSYADLMERSPDEVVRRAVRGMLPKNTLGRQQLAKLKVYPGRRPPPRRPEPPARSTAGAPGGPAEGHEEPRCPHPSPRPPAAASRPSPVSASAPARAPSPSTSGPSRTYFPSATHRMVATEPLRLTANAEAYDIDATIDGGGMSGQAGALRLGIARALIELDPELRAVLKRAGFLTRDAREKECKKYGLKKARKAPQYSKR